MFKQKTLILLQAQGIGRLQTQDIASAHKQDAALVLSKSNMFLLNNNTLRLFTDNITLRRNKILVCSDTGHWSVSGPRSCFCVKSRHSRLHDSTTHDCQVLTSGTETSQSTTHYCDCFQSASVYEFSQQGLPDEEEDMGTSSSMLSTEFVSGTSSSSSTT